jgi:parvulin-like peptidyl-prolyl isomerase
MKVITTILAISFVLVLTAATRAQEPELVNEIVARVNNDIITLADYLNALRDFREQMSREMAGKPEAQIEVEVERMKPNILDFMIENILLEQKAKELNIDVEAEVNQRMAEIAKEQGLSPLALENELRKQGVDPESARAQIRKGLQQQYVIQREVLSPIFQRLNDKDRRDFYEKHKEKLFTTPGEITISEIFLPLEGHTADEVSQRAKRLVAELRAGKNFGQAATEYSPVNRPSRDQKGKVGTFKQGELKEDINAAISTLKPGEITEPIRLQDGFQIVRLDERKPATLRAFEDADVQNYIGRGATMERAEEARKQYMKRLREEAFLDIAEKYATTAKPEKSDKN